MRKREPHVERLQPQRMPPAVVLPDLVVVVDPVLVAGVARRVNVDHANLAAVRGAQHPQRIEVVAFNDQVFKRRHRRRITAFDSDRRLAKLRPHARQDYVRVERLVALNGVSFLIQTQRLPRQMLRQQVPQMLSVQILELSQQRCGGR